MKNIYFFYFLLVTSSIAQAQNQWSYVNGDLEVVKEKEKAVYKFGPCHPSDTCRGFYITGEKFYEQIPKSKSNSGQTNIYYKNGKFRSVETYSPNGETSRRDEWYENGKKKIEGEIYAGMFEYLNYWDSTGSQKLIDGNGSISVYHDNGKLHERGEYKNKQKQGEWMEWDTKGTLYQQGSYMNSKKDGEWKKWDKTGKLVEEESYYQGTFINGIRYNDNNVIKYDQEISEPTYPGGGHQLVMDILKHLGNYSKYIHPGENQQMIVAITITSEGKAENPQVVSSINHELDKKVLAAVKKLNAVWTPYRFHGMAMTKTIYLPFDFSE